MRATYAIMVGEVRKFLCQRKNDGACMWIAWKKQFSYLFALVVLLLRLADKRSMAEGFWH